MDYVYVRACARVCLCVSFYWLQPARRRCSLMLVGMVKLGMDGSQPQGQPEFRLLNGDKI